VMQPPQPTSQDDWANAARANNFTVRANDAVLEIADREVGRQRAGHFPTLDVVASAQENTNASLAIGTATRSTVSQNAIGLQLNLPIYAGGSVLSRTREAVALKEKARQDLEASRRAAEFNAQQAFLNVTNGIAQVKALEQALASSETALQSNRVGYEVGVRINIDVLNAQQQVFQTKRDLARARYDTIVNGLKLKSAAGALSEADVEEVNRLLGTEEPKPKASAVPMPAAAAAATLPSEAATAAPAAEAPKANAVPEKVRGERKTTKADSGKKTASRPASKSKTVPVAAAGRPDAVPTEAATAVQPVALGEPVRPASSAEPVASAGQSESVAPEAGSRVVKVVEPKVPGAE
ncbi:MAG TPA: TolC family protein, partial [Burkholderiales bacterium]|nr:TolC family protein [Burkholderiales bacterium]